MVVRCWKNHPWNGWMKWDEYFRLGTNGTHYRNHGETVAVHLRSWMKWSFMETFPGGFILVNLASNGIFTKPMNWGTNSRRWISWGDTVDFSFPYQDHCGGFRWSKVRPDIGGQWMARIQAHAGCFLNFTSRFEGRVDLEWQGFLKIMFVVFSGCFFGREILMQRHDFDTRVHSVLLNPQILCDPQPYISSIFIEFGLRAAELWCPQVMSPCKASCMRPTSFGKPGWTARESCRPRETIAGDGTLEECHIFLMTRSNREFMSRNRRLFHIKTRFPDHMLVVFIVRDDEFGNKTMHIFSKTPHGKLLLWKFSTDCWW